MARRFASFTLAVGFALAVAASPPAASPALAAHPNAVIEWNRIALATFIAAGVPPSAPGNRLGAIIQTAVFDAVNGVSGRYTPLHVTARAPEGASAQAAAVSAAYTVLVALFPGQQSVLADARAKSLAAIDDDTASSIADGIQWGASVATEVVAWRAGDGFNATPPPYVFGTGPYAWQPTDGASGPPRFRTLGTMTPFILSSASQFQPPPPPALTSDRYTADFNEVKAIGEIGSTVRTAFQTETARFWALDGTIPLWDRVADDLATANHLNLFASARLLALLNAAMADSSSTVFYAKNVYNTWRPVTAIVNADADGNPDTVAEPGWRSLLINPYFQEYPSGHSGVSSAAATILASEFGSATAFAMTSTGLPGVMHSFASFPAAVAEVTNARVYAGIHFRFACEESEALGRLVANYIEAHAALRANQ